jgi:hypothetical protein
VAVIVPPVFGPSAFAAKSDASGEITVEGRLLPRKREGVLAGGCSSTCAREARSESESLRATALRLSHRCVVWRSTTHEVAT